MKLGLFRFLPLSLLLAASLGAQVPAPPAEPQAPSAPTTAPKAPAKPVKGKAKPKATPGNDAQVKREIAVGSQVRSKALKAKKGPKAPLPPPVDINSASKEELMKLPGITAAYADRIIAKRPYPTKTYLVLRGALPHAVYTSLKGRIAVLPKP